MSAAPTLLRGSVLRLVDLGVLLAASFMVTPILVHSLGDRLYGFWTLAGSIVGYYGFLDLGLSAAATKYMSETLGRGDESELDAVASTAQYLFSGLALVVLAATGASALACPYLIADPAEASLMARLILIIGASAAVGFPTKVYQGLLMAGLRYDYLAAISVARSVLLNAAIYAALRAGYGVLSVAVVTLVVTIVQREAIYRACRARFPRLQVKFSRFERSRIRAMFDFGSKMLVCQVGDILRYRVDSVVIAAFLGAARVTPYAVAVRLAEGSSQLITSFTGTMLPVFSRYQGRGDFDGIRAALLKVTRLSAVMTTFVGLSAAFYGRPFIHRWMGPGFDESWVIEAILCGAFLVGLPHSPGIQLLYGLSQHKAYSKLSVCEGLVNLALSVALIKPFGLYGVALGTLLESIVFKLVILPRYVCRAADLPLRKYLLHAILGPQLKTAAPLAVYFALVFPRVSADYFQIACFFLLQAALFTPVAYFFILGEDERRTVAEAVRGLLAREGRPEPASAKG